MAKREMYSYMYQVLVDYDNYDTRVWGVYEDHSDAVRAVEQLRKVWHERKDVRVYISPCAFAW